jgi:DNA polymerase III sliding clamp (beta) subunit (PCNA family)
MKFQVPRSLFLGALNRVAPVVGNSRHHPVLEGVLVRIEDGTMFVCATDLRVTVVDSFAIDTKENGAFCVSFGELHPWIIHSFVLGRESINVQIDSGRVRFWYPGDKSRFAPKSQYDPNEYPKTTNEREDDVIATAQGSSLATAIQQTIGVLVLKNIEYNPMFMDGVIMMNKSGLSFAASDGYVMSYTKCKADVSVGGDYSVPLKALTTIDGMLSSGGTVRIEKSNSRLTFRYGGTVVSILLNKMTFPIEQVKQMLSVNHSGKSLVIKDGVMRVINSFRGTLDDIDKKVARSISVHFDPETKEMTISPNRALDGESEESLPVQQIYGEKCDFAINYSYWLGCLKSINGIEAWIHYDPNNLQNWIHITGIDDSQRYVVAPFARNN